jgi:hypothetical protein
MVAEDGERLTLFDHGSRNPKCLDLLWTPVDEIADEDHLSLWMAV